MSKAFIKEIITITKMISFLLKGNRIIKIYIYKDTITTVYNDVVWRQGSTEDNVYMFYVV